jgi:4-oxalocrotonate tautomerase
MVQIFVPAGSLTPDQRKLMVRKVTDAVVEAEGIAAIRPYTNVLIVETVDGGWGIAGEGHTLRELAAKLRPPVA